MSRFEDLPLVERILRAVQEEGDDRPTPIRRQTIRHVLEGRDILGCARTGTGKTAAFALPVLQARQRGQAHPQASARRRRARRSGFHPRHGK